LSQYPQRSPLRVNLYVLVSGLAMQDVFVVFLDTQFADAARAVIVFGI
jgi:hypothetical protein